MPNKNRVLIVEDDKMIGSMYKTKLESEGFEIFLADNGEAGLELAKQEKPDIIMLDIILPLLDGFSVLEELKKDASTKNIPVVMLTNLSTDEDKEKGKEMGAADYLVKANLTPTQVGLEIKKHLK